MSLREAFISVIIPTHNRGESLCRSLDALAGQAYPSEALEVIVVDDGSDEDVSFVTGMDYPYALRYIRQPNRGATEARNVGARQARGEVLVFLDDDIELVPNALASLVQILEAGQKRVALGDIRPLGPAGGRPVLQGIAGEGSRRVSDDEGESYIVPFADCMTGVLAIRREDLFTLGMFQDPTTGRGWPNWDDVDFGYRAHLEGYELRRSRGARAYHRDHVLADLETRADRWRRAACAAVLLFHKHPELQSHIPMFQDKTPIAIRRDSPALIVHKLFHLVTAWRTLQWAMERSAHLLACVAPSSKLLRLLHRWTVSSYVYQGYAEGVHRYGPVPSRDGPVGFNDV